MKIRTCGRVHRLLLDGAAGVTHYRKFAGVQFSGRHIQWALEHGLLIHKLRGKYYLSKSGWEALRRLETLDPYPKRNGHEAALEGDPIDDNRFHYYMPEGEIFMPNMISAKRGYRFIEIRSRMNKKWVRYFEKKVW